MSSAWIATRRSSAQGTWDITSQLSLNGGLRYFTVRQFTLEGFYGYSSQLLRHRLGHSRSASRRHRAPLMRRAPTSTSRVTGSGNVPRVNLTYKFTPDVHGVCHLSRRAFVPAA